MTPRVRSPWEIAADLLDPPLNPFLLDPVQWGADVLGEYYWSKQVEVLEAIRDHKYVAVPSCHDAGKSFIAARVAAHWLETHQPGDAFVVSTAPTFQQVRAILWREIGKAHRKGNLTGHVNQTEWWINDEIVGYGRKPNDYDPSAFQGIHARYVLVIIDESGGVSKSLFDAVETIVTNAESRVLAIGNPDSVGSHFAAICEPNSEYHVVEIDGLRTPNFTAERVAKYPDLVRYMAEEGIEPSTEYVPEAIRPLLLDPDWVDRRIRAWGTKSELFISKVRGRFPKDDELGVILHSWLKLAQTQIEMEAIGETALGVDVGAGSDRSVIQEKRGPKFGRQWESKHKDPERLTGEIVAAAIETMPKRINIDATGWGWGIVGSVRRELRERGMKVEVNPVMVGEAAQGEVDLGAEHDDKGKNAKASEHFVNLKAQTWWDARDAVRRGEWDLSELDDDTINELSKPRYGRDGRGRIKIESKEELIKRIGYSPDKADAVILSAHVPAEESETEGFVIV